MVGYRFTLRDHLLPDCKTKKDVFVWSRAQPPCGYMVVTLPEWIENMFKERSHLHTVITDTNHVLIEQNDLVR